MSALGFKISGLRLVGDGKRDASLSFNAGLSVLSGPSETGKSFVFECLDFMLGASSPPKAIPEASGYHSVGLTIETYPGERFQLTRGLAGGPVACARFKNGTMLDTTTLGAKHRGGDPNTVSGLLLRLSGLYEKVIRTSQTGKTRNLSFRDVAPLVCIDETRIVDKRSPILSGQYIEATAEKSLFNLMLTGSDDRGVIQNESPKDRKLRKSAQVEILEGLIGALKDEIEKKGITPDSVPASVQLEQLGRLIDESVTDLRFHSEQVRQRENELRGTRESHDAAVRRVRIIDQLLARFELLDKQYESDLRRLEGIAETGHYFAQLQQERCPVCGALPEHHDTKSAWHLTSPEAIETLRQASEKEMTKIKRLRSDLAGSINDLKTESQATKIQAVADHTRYTEIRTWLDETLAPRSSSAEVNLQEMLQKQKALLEVQALSDRLASLESELSYYSAQTGDRGADPVKPRLAETSAVERLCLEIESLLRRWNFPDLGRVTYNHQKLDLIVSGKDREILGKGFRAISYAAFAIGLMRFCRKERLMHPGFVILDSPLVTYKRPDTPAHEAISEDVAMSFYRDMANAGTDEQIIVLENENPPVDIRDKIGYTHFTKSGTGRYGFIPS